MLVAEGVHAYADPYFDGKVGWSAVQAFFGLTYTSASRLFQSWSYKAEAIDPSPANVAARIREMLKEQA